VIPVRLYLQNFLSYSTAELSFQGIHTACLTGNNGNGKSALLDAITWVVWGQARGVDKNGAGMDELVRLGAEDMAVEFSFELDDQVYRVIRKRDKRRQVTALEFQIQAGDSFRSLSGDRLGLTQERIIQVLKLDYETFTNSAFILQGKADSFTTQKPTDRKRILGEILGLTYYDRLERKARDKFNDADYQLRELERKLLQLESELAGEPVVRQEWENAKSARLALSSALAARERKLGELTLEWNELQALAVKKQEFSERIESAQQRIGDLQRRAATLEIQIAGVKEILAQEEQICAGYQHLQQVNSAEEEQGYKQIRAMELIKEKGRLEQQISEARSKLAGTLAGLESEKKQLEALLTRAEEARQGQPALEQELQRAKSREREKLTLQDELVRLRGELAEKESSLRGLDKELKDLRSRFKTLQQTDAQCPLCGSGLEGDIKLSLLERLKREGTEKNAAEKVLRQEQEQSQALFAELENRLKQMAGEKLAQVESRLALQQRDLAEGEEADSKLKILLSRELELRTSLQNGAFAVEENSRLHQVEEELQTLAYSQEGHQKIRLEQKQLRIYAEQYAALSGAKAGLPSQEAALKDLKLQQVSLGTEVRDYRETIELFSLQLAKLPGLEQNLAQEKHEVGNMRLELSELDANLGALQEKMRHFAEVKQFKEENLVLRAETARVRNLYNHLITAFGKKGIQAMIIENVVPELQEEANTLLSRMTAGRMHLALLTQRDSKKGSVSETLDIRIADELGTRKYEMFSGGESFRINFALRIALSKLLARRAGAKLQTLVVDEGFGTQDGGGRESLVEVINAIKEDFAKIIVITHIQELKDAFPIQIEVEKTAQGSNLRFI